MHGGETRSLSAALGLNFLENADKNANYATALGLPSSPNSDALPPIPVSEATRSRVQKCREYFELYSAYNDLSTIGSGSSRHNPLEAIRNRKARYKERVQLDLAPWKDLEQVKDWVNQTLNQPGYDGRQGRPTLPPPPIPNNPHVAEGPRRRPKMDWIISPEELLADFYAAKTRPLADFKCEYGRPEVAGPASSVDKRNRLGEEPKALRHNAYDAALGDKDDEAKPHRDHHGFRHNPFSRAHKDGYSSSDEDGMFSSGDESDKRLAALRKMKSKVSPPGRKRHHFRRRPTRADSHDSQGLDSDAQFADDAKWNSYGAATSGPPEHREPDSSDSDADGYHSEADYADNTIQIRRPQGGRPSFDFADVVVPSIAINLDPPKPREKTRKEEKKERKEEKKEMKEEKERESPAKSKVKPSPLRIAPKTSMEDDEVSRGRGAGSRKPSFGQDSNGEDVTALAAMRNKGASAAMSKILRRKGSPSKNRSQNDLITDDDTQHEKESRIKSPARKAKHMVDSRVEKIKQEVAKVEGYIKGKDGEKSGHHDSSAPSSYPSSAVSGSEDERGEKWRENLSFSITKRRPKLMQTQTAPSLVPQARRPLPPIPTERDPLVIPGNKARGIPDIRPERPIMVFPQVQKHYSRVQQVAGEARAERTRGLERAQSMEDIGRRHRRGEPLREVLEADKRLNEILKTPPRRGGTFHPPKGLWKSFQFEIYQPPSSPAHPFVSSQTSSHQLQTNLNLINDGTPDLVTPTTAASTPSPSVPQFFLRPPGPSVHGKTWHGQESYFSLPALSLANLHDGDHTKSISPKEVLEMILPTTPILPEPPTQRVHPTRHHSHHNTHSHSHHHQPPLSTTTLTQSPTTLPSSHTQPSPSHLAPPTPAPSISRSLTLPRNIKLSAPSSPPCTTAAPPSQQSSKRSLRLLNGKLPMLQTHS